MESIPRPLAAGPPLPPRRRRLPGRRRHGKVLYILDTIYIYIYIQLGAFRSSSRIARRRAAARPPTTRRPHRGATANVRTQEAVEVLAVWPPAVPAARTAAGVWSAPTTRAAAARRAGLLGPAMHPLRSKLLITSPRPPAPRQGGRAMRPGIFARSKYPVPSPRPPAPPARRRRRPLSGAARPPALASQPNMEKNNFHQPAMQQRPSLR